MELRSSQKRQKEDVLRILPSWSILLDKVEEVQGSWIIGMTREESKVEELIDEYCRSLPCDFVKRHSKNMWDSKDTPSRLLWETKDCPYSGVPFYVVSHDVLLCTMNHNSKTRKKCAISKGSKLSGRKKALAKNSSCEANIIVKRMKRYPTYAIATSATTLERLSALKTLKQDLEGGCAPAAQEVFWVRVPLASVHSHAFHGRTRFTHPSIRNKILDLIHDGVESSDGIMPLLRSHVEQRFRGSINPPALDDQAYYPSIERVKNILYNYSSRKKRKIGGKSVFENVSSSLGTEEEVGVCNCSPQTISDEPNTILEQAVLETIQSNSTENTSQAPSFNVPSMESNVINTTSNVINTTSNVINTTSNVINTTLDQNVCKLRAEVGEKITQLSKLNQSTNDSKKLKMLLDYLNSSPAVVDDVSIGNCISEFASCPVDNIFSDLYNVDGSETGNSAQYTIQPYLNGVPGVENHPVFETNQIVPSHRYMTDDFVSKEVTYTVMNNVSVADNSAYDEMHLQTVHDNFSPLLNHQMQSFPAIANLVANYPSL